MARTAITVQAPALAGATPTYGSVDQANGNSFVWPGVPCLLHIKNTNAANRTITLTNNGAKLGGLALASPTLLIPLTSGDKMIALVDPSGLLQADGSIYLDWDAATNVTIAVVRLQ
jgi:hypothetical protein